MREFFAKQRTNIVANLVASAIFAIVMGGIALLASVPPVPVPAWLFVVIAAFLAGWWWFSKPPKKLTPVVNESFGVEQVILDGKHFISCTFKGTELIFNGSTGFSFERCRFVSHHLRFQGAAGTTLTMLAAMYQEQGFKKCIDYTLNQVREHGGDS